MHKTIVVVILFLFLASVGFSFVPAWREIHERADRITLSEALGDVQKNPSSPEALYALALVYLNAYKINEAEEVFEKMSALDAGNLAARWGKAEILRRRHKFDEAQGILETIIKEDPLYAPAYTTLGYMLFDKKEYEYSIRLAVRVLKMGRERVDLTNYTRAYLIIGGAKGILADEGGPFSKLFNGTQILSYLKKAEKLQPRSAGVLFGLGSFYSLAPAVAGGDKAKGLIYLENVIKVDPLFVDGYARLAQVWGRRGDKEKYDFYLKKALELDPQNELALRVKKDNVR